MSPYRRNVMVGGVVLGALVILAWMLIQFGSSMMSPFAPSMMKVRFVTDRADGLSNGSAVVYRGVSVGRVDVVTRADDELQVFIDASVDRNPPLPGNLRALIRSQGLVGGGASLVLELADPQPTGKLQEHQQLAARFIGLDILPPEFAQLAAELRMTSQQFRESNIIAHVDEQVKKAGELIDSAHGVISDPQTQTNFRESLAHLRAASERADQITTDIQHFSGGLDKLSGQASAVMIDARTTIAKSQEQIVALSQQVGERLQQASKVLDQFEAISKKVNDGQGTAAALLNDPKLYQNLVETAQQLNGTAADLRRLIDQWEQDGVSLKLK